jgi:hypothetical protein
MKKGIESLDSRRLGSDAVARTTNLPGLAMHLLRTPEEVTYGVTCSGACLMYAVATTEAVTTALHFYSEIRHVPCDFGAKQRQKSGPTKSRSKQNTGSCRLDLRRRGARTCFYLPLPDAKSRD